MGCTPAAGGSYQWLLRTMQGISPELSYVALNTLAERVPAGSEGVLFLPYLIGECTPHSDPKLGGFSGVFHVITDSNILCVQS